MAGRQGQGWELWVPIALAVLVLASFLYAIFSYKQSELSECRQNVTACAGNLSLAQDGMKAYEARLRTCENDTAFWKDQYAQLNKTCTQKIATLTAERDKFKQDYEDCNNQKTSSERKNNIANWTIIGLLVEIVIGFIVACATIGLEDISWKWRIAIALTLLIGLVVALNGLGAITLF